MADLAQFEALVHKDHGLAVIAVTGPDGNVRPSVANVGVIDHPVTGARVVAVVVVGRARKLDHIRSRPRASATLRAGWQWAAVEGPAEIVGPDDPMEGVSAERLRVLLREIFIAAGGTHDDFDAYDRAMVDERRAAVLITPARVYG